MDGQLWLYILQQLTNFTHYLASVRFILRTMVCIFRFLSELIFANYDVLLSRNITIHNMKTVSSAFIFQFLFFIWSGSKSLTSNVTWFCIITIVLNTIITYYSAHIFLGHNQNKTNGKKDKETNV